ncbi:heme-binding-like protein At3g10130, chloroplastic [Phalaenopsis equestris]|uniref:heme-binding-like protein At3g10130, chloroplastic n=1 Tax=Phalaenopsis equestris TaxID=78828 RepID=UPI0009E46066|nr:heme-binding-like protein At3g10130, chloroplastic [Phalaenopsis equestris]XP_020581536.1 heme-binding-like protein At3g10130, chloroplastic [Phalaenopsis equestris]
MMLVVVTPISIPRPPKPAPGTRRSPVKILAAVERGDRTPGILPALDTRSSLVLALASQAFSQTQRVLGDLVGETAKYAIPRRFEPPRNFEEALMAVPDLETISFRLVKQTDQYVIREVEPYHVAETTIPGKDGFNFSGASQAFNALAAYLFGKNTSNKQMEMTTPVYTRKVRSDGERMDMTAPVITKQSGEKWQMSFVMPRKNGTNLPLPKDPSVTIKVVPGKTVAVSAFSGFLTDEDVKRRESKLRDALKNDFEFQVKRGAMVEIAQYNPPFTLPFTRRNEISLEVERKA